MTLSNALFWGWAGLFWQSPEKVPRAPSSRIPAILWYAAGVTLVASYTANLVTFLTGKKSIAFTKIEMMVFCWMLVTEKSFVDNNRSWLDMIFLSEKTNNAAGHIFAFTPSNVC